MFVQYILKKLYFYILGDLQGALDLRNIDPLVTYKLLFKLKDLLVAMVCANINKS